MSLECKSSTLSAPNFRRHFSYASALFSLTNYQLEIRLYEKLKDRMSNRVDPDETAHYEHWIRRPNLEAFEYCCEGQNLAKCYNGSL